jgi:hypothetical protein
MMLYRTILLMLLVPVWAIPDSVVLILNGVPGSPAHEERFSAWTEATRMSMVDTFGFDEQNVVTLERARAEDVENAFRELDERVGPDDVFFLFMIGHGSFDGSDYKFNIVGPDLTASDFDRLLSSVDAGRFVVVNATNSSGGGIEELAAPNRVIVTATRTGTERNDTIFYDHFLKAFADAASDEDKNERLSVWEAFRFAAMEVARFYEEETRIATEHPQISDNGDEKAGLDTEDLPTLARVVHFNVEREIEVADPALRALLERRREIEADLDALRLVADALPPEEYEQRLEELLVELALTNQQIRALEPSGAETGDDAGAESGAVEPPGPGIEEEN